MWISTILILLQAHGALVQALHFGNERSVDKDRARRLQHVNDIYPHERTQVSMRHAGHDYEHDAIIRNTTAFLDDFAPLLVSASGIECVLFGAPPIFTKKETLFVDSLGAADPGGGRQGATLRVKIQVSPATTLNDYVDFVHRFSRASIVV